MGPVPAGAGHVPLDGCKYTDKIFAFTSELKKILFLWIKRTRIMKVCLLVIGKTDASYMREAIAEYEKRLTRHVPYEMKVLPDVRNARSLTESLQKEREGEMLLEQFRSGDWVVLLDERGRQHTSVEFARYLEQKMLGGVKRLLFVVGGPYGFADKVYRRADDRISLSRMTFSHQMVRMIFIEQIYRAMTILKGEPYHHE